jgi:flagellar biogenesis protein FliO
MIWLYVILSIIFVGFVIWGIGRIVSSKRIQAISQKVETIVKDSEKIVKK